MSEHVGALRFPRRSGGGSRPWVRIAAAFVAVLALTFGFSAIERSNHPDRTAAATSGSPVSSIIGAKWLLSSVEANGSRTVVPTSVGAFLALSMDGTFVYDDGVNATSGRYGTTASGFNLVGRPDITAAGASEATGLLRTVVDGMDRIRSAAPDSIVVTVANRILQLRIRGITLGFSNGGSVAAPPPPATTP